MTRTFDAVFEDGVLRPLESVDGITEHARVKVTIETLTTAGNSLADCIGTLPDEDAAEIRQIVEDEFEQVNLSEW